MTKNNKGNLFVFEVGPSVKLGGSEGSLAKDHTFSGFSFCATFPNFEDVN